MKKLSWQDIKNSDNYVNLAVAIEEAGGSAQAVLRPDRTLEDFFYTLECNGIEIIVKYKKHYETR